MQQHPVPQHIAGYEFRLVGDMTLKQFLELAAGVVVAVIIYNSGLPLLIRWPLIIFSGLAGAAFAFLPFQERPLDIWVKNFFKSVYSPTLFLWKKQEKLPDFFKYQAPKEKKAPPRRLSPEERAKFAEYLKSLPKEKALSAYDKVEEESLGKINQFLQTATGADPNRFASAGIFPSTPMPSIRVRRLRGKQEIKRAPEPVKTPPPKIVSQPTAPSPMVKIAEPLGAPIEIGTPFTPPPPKPKPVKLPKKKAKIKKTAKPAVPVKLPIPNPPEIANVIVGMVLDTQGKILPNAIVEIRDLEGMPVRASKTNKLGQFFIVTPLQDGEYEIETEASNQSFDIIKVKTEGKIIPPIKIQAKA